MAKLGAQERITAPLWRAASLRLPELRRQPSAAASLWSASCRKWNAERVDQRWLALQTMEEAWLEGKEHMAKLSINALVGLFATWTSSTLRTSNH